MLTVNALSIVAVTLLIPLQQQPDSFPAELGAAYRALKEGRVDEAVRSAERYSRNHPRDPNGFLALGDAYAARVPGGRFRALQAYREAKRLAPADPEPPYRLARLALQLGGDDGERIAREELEGILALDPLYKDAWRYWLTLYRNSGGRRRMVERMLAHRQNQIMLPRIALLLMEEESYREANRLLDSALTGDSTSVALNALRSQSAFEDGDTSLGMSFYRVALAHAARDSSDVLWGQVIGIATPSEVRQWITGVPPQDKGAWLHSFWARRNSNLFFDANHRISEHFARLRYARKHYPLLHPLVTYHRSALGRTLNLAPSQGEREHHLRCEVFQAMPPAEGQRIPMPGVTRARDRMGWSSGALAHLTTEEKRALPDAVRRVFEAAEPGSTLPTLFAPLGLDLRDIDTTAARVGYNLATGLDDRGLMYLRFGPPDHLKLGGDNAVDPQCATTELERWRYAQLGEVRFSRPSAFSRGARTTPEMVFRPMNAEQFETMKLGLTRDAPSERAPFSFGVWTAHFRNAARPVLSDLIVVATTGELAASLVGGQTGAQQTQVGAAGYVSLPVAPNRYILLAHARRGDTLGRQTLAVAIRAFGDAPGLSDLLVASPWPTTAVDRDAMLEHVRRDLTFRSGESVRVYAELYGLSPTAGRIAYHASYHLLKTGDPSRDIQRESWRDAVTFEFDRERPASPTGVDAEVLDIDPRYLPSGTYLLRLEVSTPGADRLLGRSTIALVVR